MQHGHDMPNHIEVWFWHVEPRLERDDELRAHLLAWHRVEVGEWLKEDLYDVSAVLVSCGHGMCDGLVTRATPGDDTGWPVAMTLIVWSAGRHGTFVHAWWASTSRDA